MYIKKKYVGQFNKFIDFMIKKKFWDFIINIDKKFLINIFIFLK